MHTIGCHCHQCTGARRRVFPIEPFGAPRRGGRYPGAEVLSEAEEVELAMELLGVTGEAEMEQFLGKLFRGIGRGLKKVLPALGGALKGLAKKALPFVGGALGSFIPIPGVGTALGSALGGALSKALELEFGELENEEAEFEIARRFVRVAASAAQHASSALPNADPEAVVRDALLAAARRHVPSFAQLEAELVAEAESEWEAEGEGEGEWEAESESGGEAEWEAEGEAGYEAEAETGAISGRWVRRGRSIVVQGA